MHLVHVDALSLQGLSQLLSRQLHGHPQLLRLPGVDLMNQFRP
jgi:hypothetical protein